MCEKCPVIPAVPVPALAVTPLRHGTAQPPTLMPVTTPVMAVGQLPTAQRGSGRGAKGPY
jgi:hypothetical protein